MSVCPFDFTNTIEQNILLKIIKNIIKICIDDIKAFLYIDKSIIYADNIGQNYLDLLKIKLIKLSNTLTLFKIETVIIKLLNNVINFINCNINNNNTIILKPEIIIEIVEEIL
jgi:hypothetical protein